ncbi:hypothetical protein BAUCODRAFT_74427 [Baudoinia panamericana UAMH 10762]|uniref:DNA topoisomerase (ATP-hydrolyzing) n=1 Tax=Baudoinia panamericana (strain UAMH 10762) TaxID=717646 RepID=M2MC94_BAUPA|nr:uncharacterized protein BAUCODRAFT_74427 [Baudoinia panamericana UAMH 10762]EMC94131.1 hypothetical protein BAUCODRAFT_74427 [Baudoinia panamericana UAMH 10762]
MPYDTKTNIAGEIPNSVQEKIGLIFQGLNRDLLEQRDGLALTLRTRTRQASSSSHENGNARDVKFRRLCFPGRGVEDAWRFTVVLRMLELVHEALSTGKTLSKRDIYYRDPALFGSQTHVDRYIDDIAFTFDVPRSALNVTAVAKGLILGAVTFCRRDGSNANAAVDREGVLVPPLSELLSVSMKAVKWVLVIEKEASFRSLASSNFWDRLSTEGVLLTGKGYPDIATRALLRFLSEPSPQNGFASPPVYGLVDFDPDGLAILATYKHGSFALAHENSSLQVPQLKWLGLRSEHILMESDDPHASQGLMMLTPRDRGKARKMLERSVPGSISGALEADSEEWRGALQVMLMLNVKAELQLLDAQSGGVSELLESYLAMQSRYTASLTRNLHVDSP